MTKKSQQKKKDKYPDYQENNVVNNILFFSLLILVVLLSVSKLSNEDDFFWHFATGRYIIESGTVPSADVFGHTTQGAGWIPFEWGWDVITYLIFSSLGYLGLVIFCSLIAVSIISLFYYLLKKLKVSDTVSIFFLLVFLFGVFERFVPRPQIISYLFFTLLIFIFISYRYINRSNYKILFLLPLIFLIWTNMHMGIIAGVVLFIIYIIAEFLTYKFPKKFSSREITPMNKAELVRLVLIFIACLLVMFLNPHGLNTYIYAYKHLQMKMLENVNEWNSPFFERFVGRFYFNVYLFFLISIIPVLYYSVKKKDIFAAILSVSFGLNSLRALRYTVDFIILTLVFSAVSVNFILQNLRNRRIKEFLTLRPELKLLLILIIIFLAANIPGNKLYYSYLKYTRFSGVGLDSNYYPVKMFNFIRENNISEIGEKPFNTFECGGYYIWEFPGKKNFIDSRNLNDSIMNDYQQIYSRLPGFEKKIESIGFDYAICVIPDMPADPQLMKITMLNYFFNSPDKWKLIWWNDRGALFVKNENKFSDLISKYEYKTVNPYNIIFNRNLIDKKLTENKQGIIQEINMKKAEEYGSIFLTVLFKNHGNKLTLE